MNCEQFKERIMDLARESGLEDSVRSSALAHAESCPDCSGKLASQRILTGMFKLAVTDSSEAPARVEAALLDAYRSRHATSRETTFPRRAGRSIPFHYWGIAATLLLAILGTVAVRSYFRPTPVHEVEFRSGASGESAAAVTVPVAKAPKPATPVDRTAPTVAENVPASKTSRPREPVSAPAAADEVEIATDFFPLTSKAEFSAMESGQLVRVLLPRDSMASFGLPVNRERIDKPVTAQVLIGQDGVARAIRFLSMQNTNYLQTGMRSK